MTVEVKICGLTEADGMEAAMDAGADYVGLVFFSKSPRNVEPDWAGELAQIAEDAVKVGLFVDADDALLDRVVSQVRLDLLQFHGTETPERIEQVRLEYGLPVMKVIPLGGAGDLAAADPYLPVADRLLFDARPPAGSDLPGGNAVRFDWSILKGFSCALPWMLAGGLDAGNVAEAIRQTGARAVDVSSGVESAPGIKDPDKIRAFITAAKGR
ncbi:phosphoribosylanthranilate isomerase [Magnetospirillum sp. UT-4]|uniref:phosphoribosylanthranilate isomerase n=1 Tax=Magnetospirillum sp. UT-4 TaxID=2681467 RepID=UPI00137D2C49|nr:phosphoribosylanthranilate isomerase [Magnetospirillum sp. UT-4]CAA7611868.1 N-(5'-phosphoribosyl)anthranilate isomerase [Magnetospirillum sp. UT-4]